MECQFCKKVLSSTSSLNYHQKNTKSCLKIQGKEVSNQKIQCEFCKKVLSSKSSYKRHIGICSYKYRGLEDQLYDKEKEIIMLKNTIKELREDKRNLQQSYEKLSLTAVKRPTISNKTMNVNNFIKNMQPLTVQDIENSVPMLTLEQHAKGAEGYFPEEILSV